MDVKIDSKAEQPLLSRRVVKGHVGFQGATPSRAELKKKLAEALKVEEGCVSVESIDTLFGQSKAAFAANIYSSPEVLGRTESVVMLARHGLREKKAAKQPAAK